MSDTPNGDGRHLLDPAPAPALQSDVDHRFATIQREMAKHSLQLERIDVGVQALVRGFDQMAMRLGPMESDHGRLAIAVEHNTTALDEMAVQFKSLAEIVGALRLILTRPPVTPTAPNNKRPRAAKRRR